METIGDAYMVVGGAPEATPRHAQNICDMSLDMVESITQLKDPYNSEDDYYNDIIKLLVIIIIIVRLWYQ